MSQLQKKQSFAKTNTKGATKDARKVDGIEKNKNQQKKNHENAVKNDVKKVLCNGRFT